MKSLVSNLDNQWVIQSLSRHCKYEIDLWEIWNQLHTVPASQSKKSTMFWQFVIFTWCPSHYKCQFFIPASTRVDPFKLMHTQKKSLYPKMGLAYERYLLPSLPPISGSETANLIKQLKLTNAPSCNINTKALPCPPYSFVWTTELVLLITEF